MQAEELARKIQGLGGPAPVWTFDAASFDSEDVAQVDEVAAHLLTRFYEADDADAFRLLVDVATPRLMDIARGIVTDLCLATDPESLVAAYMSKLFTDLRERRPESHYFLAEADRAMRSGARRLIETKEAAAPVFSELVQAVGDVPLQGRTAAVYRFGAYYLAVVQGCFHSLQETDRRLLLAAEVEGLDARQIAERFTIPATEVEPMLRDARRRFAERLGAAFSKVGASKGGQR